MTHVLIGKGNLGAETDMHNSVMVWEARGTPREGRGRECREVSQGKEP